MRKGKFCLMTQEKCMLRYIYLMKIEQEMYMYSPTMTNHDVLVHEMWFFWIFWKMTESVKRTFTSYQ